MVLKTIYSTHLFYTRKLRPKEERGLPKGAKEPNWKDLEKLKGGAEFPPIIHPTSPRIKPHWRLPGVPIKPRLASVSLWALGASPTVSWATVAHL